MDKLKWTTADEDLADRMMMAEFIKRRIENVMMPHSEDSRCICTDGKANQRDITEMCE